MILPLLLIICGKKSSTFVTLLLERNLKNHVYQIIDSYYPYTLRQDVRENNDTMVTFFPTLKDYYYYYYYYYLKPLVCCILPAFSRFSCALLEVRVRFRFFRFLDASD